MARLCYALACTQVLTDSVSQLPSYISCLTGVTFGLEESQTLPPFVVCCHWARDVADEHLELRVGLKLPDGNVKRPLRQPLSVTLSKPYHRTTLNMGPYSPAIPGDYELQVQSRAPGGRWVVKARIPFHAVAPEDPPGATA
jgi:hypothetical protein